MKNKILRRIINSVKQSENVDIEIVLTIVVLMFFHEFEPDSLLSFYQILFPKLEEKKLVLQFLQDVQNERLYKLKYFDSCQNGWIVMHKDLPYYFINEDGFIWSVEWKQIIEGMPEDDDLYLIQDGLENIETACLYQSIASKFIKFTEYTGYYTVNADKWADIKPIGDCYECFR